MSQNFEKDQYARKKKAFLEEAAKEMQPKSFYDKHYWTPVIAGIASKVVFSPISVFFGCITTFSIALWSFGVNTSMLESFSTSPLMAWSLLGISVIVLGFFELGKHHFWKQGLTEKYRKTDDFGQREIRFALFFQLVSVSLSFAGGYLVANELAGTEKAAILASINEEYEPLIAAKTADITKYNGKEFKNAQGKTLYKVLPTIAKLESEKTDLEAQYKAAKEEAGVGAGFVAASETGTLKMIAILGGLQIFIEICLTLCLWWIVYFKSRSIHEEGNDEGFENPDDKILDNISFQSSTPPYQNQGINPMLNVLGNNNMPQNNQHTVVKGFVNRTNNTQPQTTHNISTQKPVSIVAQDTQAKKSQKSQSLQQETTIKAVDVSSEKKRVYEYIPRLLKNYTENNFLSIREDVKTLAKAGYTVAVKPNNRAKIAKTEATDLGVMVIWNDDKKDLIIKYES